MYVEQLYTNCLAQAAYYIESNGESAIIDPMRDIDDYLSLSKKRNTKIKYIFETHFHADFVSGHLDLQKKTNADIVFGPNATPNYDAYIAKHHEEFSIGDVKIKVLHTPGHTMESSTFLLVDEEGKDHAIFSGDTLFIGDVGRPDLAVKSDLTERDLAGHLFDSLENEIKPLADDVIVYPGHGAGSACGKNLSKEKVSTIGAQKSSNYAMKQDDKESFINELIDGLSEPPSYFFKDATINKMGYDVTEAIFENVEEYDLDEFESNLTDETQLLDIRIPHDFETGFIPNSINVGLNGQFANWAGNIIDYDHPIILILRSRTELDESLTRLARVGFENVIGYIYIDTWKKDGKEIHKIKSIEPEEMNFDEVVLDIRNQGEYDSAHLEAAIHIALGELESRIGELDKSKSYTIHCAGGYRSMIAASIMKKHGFNNLKNVLGGFAKIKLENYQILETACSNS